jgi:hypothetical protein
MTFVWEGEVESTPPVPPGMSKSQRLRLALASFCLGMIGAHAILIYRVREEFITGSPDFRIFYTAGLMLRRGQGHALYNDDLQQQTQREFAPVATARNGPLPYNHPPIEEVVFVGMTLLPYHAAFFVWCLLNLFLLGIAVYCIRSSLPMLRESPWLLFLAPLAFYPIIFALMEGQDSILLLLVYCLTYNALRQGKELRAGIWLGLGLFKYHLVVPFAFVLLLQRRWRVLQGWLVAAIAEGAISWAMVGGAELLEYPRYALLINRQQHHSVIVPENMPNLRGLLTGWAVFHPPPRVLELALALISVGILVWASSCWRSSDLTDTARWDAGFSVALVVTFLVGYHGYNQDMSILLLPVLLAADKTLGAIRGYGTWMKATVGLMFLTPLYFVLTLRLQHQNLFSIILLCLAGGLAAVAKTTPGAWGDRRTTQPSAPLG